MLPIIHLEFVRIESMQAGEYWRLYGALKEVDDHQDQRVARDGHVPRVVDVVKLRPDFHYHRQRPQAPVH